MLIQWRINIVEAICAREINVKGISLFLLEEVMLTQKDIVLKTQQGCYCRNWLGTLAWLRKRVLLSEHCTDVETLK